MLQSREVKISPRGVKKYHVFQGVDDEFKLTMYSLVNPIVHFDPDVDGVISGLLVCRFLAKHGKTYNWYINSNRSHDWSLPLNAVRGRDIVAVDFIVSPDKVKELCDVGCNVVSIDHHVNGLQGQFSYKSKYYTRGLIINNQHPGEEEDSRYLSGAGVVFESLVQIDPEMDTAENRALVGITLLSDIREIENPLAEWYLYNLYTHRYKGYIKYLIDATMGEKDYGFGIPRMDRNFVDFKFSPAINSCLRFNKQNDVVNFMMGRGSLDLGYHKKQKELVAKILEKCKVINLEKLKICYFMEEDFMQYADVLSNFVGLVASKNLDGNRSVICYMLGNSKVKNIKRASFRGNINGLDYQGSLMYLFQCLGHKSAFGIKGIIPSKSTFLSANEKCRMLEEEENYQKTIINVQNLSMFNANKIAEDNMYKLSQNRVYIRYKGTSIHKRRSGSNYAEYVVNGVPVLSFGNKQVTDGLILPILERGIVNFYLE